MDGWEPNDEAWDEHTRHASNCPLVRLDTEHGRRLTFLIVNSDSERSEANKCRHWWPHNGTLAPERMARAGFFFWPKLQSKGHRDGIITDDTAICFQCGLALDGWEVEDDPHYEHARRRPECPFILKGVALHPCSYEFLLASKPDITAVTHISAANQTKNKAKPANEIPTFNKSIENDKVNNEKMNSVQMNFKLPSKRITKKRHSNSLITTATPTVTKRKSTIAIKEEIKTIKGENEDRKRLKDDIVTLSKNQNLLESLSCDTKLLSKSLPVNPSSSSVPTFDKPYIDSEILNALGLNTVEEAEQLTVDEYINLLLHRRLEQFDAQATKLLSRLEASST